jgi:hypothetical protein
MEEPRYLHSFVSDVCWREAEHVPVTHFRCLQANFPATKSTPNNLTNPQGFNPTICASHGPAILSSQSWSIRLKLWHPRLSTPRPLPPPSSTSALSAEPSKPKTSLPNPPSDIYSYLTSEPSPISSALSPVLS